MTSWLTQYHLTRAQAFDLYPNARRFLNLGFELEPKLHGDGKIGLASPNQKLRLDVLTGDFECVL